MVKRRTRRREATALAEWPPLGQFVEVAGRRIHAYVEGHGPDIVLIHGASGNLRDFTWALAGQLRDRYRVIAMDRPGMGYSDRAGSEFGGAFNNRAESPAEQAAMMAAAARQLGADAPIVLGHSYGASVAMAWALNEGASAVVNLCGATMPWEGPLGPLYRINGSTLGGAILPPVITAFATDDYIDSVIEAIFTPQIAPRDYAEYVGPGLTVRTDVLRANARQVNSLKPHVTEMARHYPALKVPVEIVHGDEDVIVPLHIHSEPLVKVLPTAHLVILPGVGHMPHHADPIETVAAIDRAATRAGLR